MPERTVEEMKHRPHKGQPWPRAMALCQVCEQPMFHAIHTLPVPVEEQ
jgi:hypothetical protein